MRKLVLAFLPLLLFACKGPGLGGFPKGTFGNFGEMRKSLSLLAGRERSSLGELLPGISFFWETSPKLSQMKQGIQTLLHPSSDMSLKSTWNNFLVLWSREQISPWR